jgi:hypothetical protein
VTFSLDGEAPVEELFDLGRSGPVDPDAAAASFARYDSEVVPSETTASAGTTWGVR